MQVAVSDRIVGGMMVVLALLGLFLAARAEDDAMYVFGLSLSAFSYIFIFGQVRRHCDASDAARHEAANG